MWIIQMLLFSCVGSIYINKVSVRVPGGRDAVEAIALRHGCRVLGSIGSLPDYYLLEHSKIPKYHSKPSTQHVARLANEEAVKYVKQETLLQRHKRERKTLNIMFNDPSVDKMWFVNGDLNLNVQAAWRAGWTGRDVVVTVVDDGIERNHSDLVANYDPLASYDYNDYDSDPMLRYDYLGENKHGTLCAGVVSAAANNSVCAVGVSFKAKLGAIRMLDGDQSDAIEAASLTHKIQYVDIYSCSWGPRDDGTIVAGPKELAKIALRHGATMGREGKGCIYVWASGNGGRQGDTCSVDGYVNSIYTIGIAAVTSTGESPYYAEKCSAILVATFSSGYSNINEYVVSSDIRNSCTEIFSGTSAATPMAAGVIALVLEANKDLTWRDIQYITLMSARSDQLPDGQWEVNGVGRRFSHRYGFGIMDAYTMINLARGWTTVPKQENCSLLAFPRKILEGIETGETIHTEDLYTSNSSCEERVKFVEHIELKIAVRYNGRGRLAITVTSPMKTRSTLLFSRRKDHADNRYVAWPFMSVHFWGEDAQGVWTVELMNELTKYNTGYLSSIELILYGTSITPFGHHAVTSTTESIITLACCKSENSKQPTTLASTSEPDASTALEFLNIFVESVIPESTTMTYESGTETGIVNPQLSTVVESPTTFELGTGSEISTKLGAEMVSGKVNHKASTIVESTTTLESGTDLELNTKIGSEVVTGTMTPIRGNDADATYATTIYIVVGALIGAALLAVIVVVTERRNKEKWSRLKDDQIPPELTSPKPSIDNENSHSNPCDMVGSTYV